MNSNNYTYINNYSMYIKIVAIINTCVLLQKILSCLPLNISIIVLRTSIVHNIIGQLIVHLMVNMEYTCSYY